MTAIRRFRAADSRVATRPVLPLPSRTDGSILNIELHATRSAAERPIGSAPAQAGGVTVDISERDESGQTGITPSERRVEGKGAGNPRRWIRSAWSHP